MYGILTMRTKGAKRAHASPKGAYGMKTLGGFTCLPLRTLGGFTCLPLRRRARLMVGLLAAALTATACGSRLQTGELQAANGVLTRHTTTAGAAASTAGGGTGAAGPAGSPEAAAGSTAAGAPEAASQAGVSTGNAGGALSTG